MNKEVNVDLPLGHALLALAAHLLDCNTVMEQFVAAKKSKNLDLELYKLYAGADQKSIMQSALSVQQNTKSAEKSVVQQEPVKKPEQPAAAAAPVSFASLF